MYTVCNINHLCKALPHVSAQAFPEVVISERSPGNSQEVQDSVGMCIHRDVCACSVRVSWLYVLPYVLCMGFYKLSPSTDLIPVTFIFFVIVCYVRLSISCICIS